MPFCHRAAAVCLQLAIATGIYAQATPVLHIYSGNTHAHTEFTWSHGEQWAKGNCVGIQTYTPQQDDPSVSLWSAPSKIQGDKCAAIYVLKGLQFPAPGLTLRDDWRKVQGPPARHFQLAHENGFDFYATTDHSQEDPFFPSSPDNATWLRTKQEAAAATSKDFVAIAGFEFSENNGPGGEGHINVLNADSMLNALQPGINLPFLYKWLTQQKPNGSGPIVASFNHPGISQYNDWDYRTAGVTEIITMLELINSNRAGHYPGFIAALDHGWKVAPVSGRDNHGLTGINKTSARTFVLATDRTRPAILEAMAQRRVYASLDTNIQCRYTVNGQMMGSTLAKASAYAFDIRVSDPDTTEAGEKITRLDIIRDGGEVVETWMPPEPSYSVHWTTTIADTKSHYFFVRVWNAGGGNAFNPDPTKPVAWLAPVWTGRPGVVKESSHTDGKPTVGSPAD